ncbi:MAG: response regulator [Bdellovibrionota bacterium]
MERKILVVDDDLRLGHMTGKVLGRMFLGANVFVSPSGPAGLEVVERHRPHVIVLDHVMPEMDGKEFLTALRGNDWGRDVPVLVMSGYDLDYIYKGEANVVFLRKPPRRGAIEDALVKLLLKAMGQDQINEGCQEFADWRDRLGQALFSLSSKPAGKPLGRWSFHWRLF